jgi:DNA modification methylase
MTVKILNGDVRAMLKTLADESVHCVVTSPPYYGLRMYGTPAQIWGADPDCTHIWGDQLRKTGGSGFQGRNSQRWGRSNVRFQETIRDAGNICTECGAWRGHLGLEPSPHLFLDHMLEVFDEVWRVLRKDGTLWLNFGDSYAASRSYQVSDNKNPEVGPTRHLGRARPAAGLKEKDLIGMPWRLALALQDVGWWLRQEIIWAKPNPMPESVGDRCTKSHEHIFLLAKSETYYFDVTAIAEPCSEGTNPRRANNGWKTPDGWDTTKGEGGHGSFHKDGREDYDAGQLEHRTKVGLVDFADKCRKLAEPGSGTKNNTSMDDALAIMPTVRNKRSVWTITTEGFAGEFCTACRVFYEGDALRALRVTNTIEEGFEGEETTIRRRYCACGCHDKWMSHFATFPTELVKPCILAGTSEHGVCSICGAPWERVTERRDTGWDGSEYGKRAVEATAGVITGGTEKSTLGSSNGKMVGQRETAGWRPTCTCEDNAPIPATVLDPFFGTGTTGLVADRLKRHAIGIELNRDFATMAQQRITGETPLFTKAEVT